MHLLFDTNIVLDFLRNGPITQSIDQEFDLNSSDNDLIISVVTIGELNAIALKRNWGVNRINRLQSDLLKFLVVPVNSKDILDAYAAIDAFSQGRLKDKPLPRWTSARNMGKNDIWIAAAAFVTKSVFLTTDKDFSHLKDAFLEVKIYDPSSYY